jgi:hypothetical protein
MVAVGGVAVTAPGAASPQPWLLAAWFLSVRLVLLRRGQSAAAPLRSGGPFEVAPPA